MLSLPAVEVVVEPEPVWTPPPAPPPPSSPPVTQWEFIDVRRPAKSISYNVGVAAFWFLLFRGIAGSDPVSKVAGASAYSGWSVPVRASCALSHASFRQQVVHGSPAIRPNVEPTMGMPGNRTVPRPAPIGRRRVFNGRLTSPLAEHHPRFCEVGEPLGAPRRVHGRPTPHAVSDVQRLYRVSLVERGYTRSYGSFA